VCCTVALLSLLLSAVRRILAPAAVLSDADRVAWRIRVVAGIYRTGRANLGRCVSR
jgi:hypothetical protein